MFVSATKFASAMACIAAFAATADARVWAGSIDMIQACKWQYGEGWSASVTGGTPGSIKTAFDWECWNGDDRRPKIDVAAFCLRRYGLRDGSAPYADPQGGFPYDWGCYWP